MLQGRGKRMHQYSYHIKKSFFSFPDIRYFATRNSLMFKYYSVFEFASTNNNGQSLQDYFEFVHTAGNILLQHVIRL